MAQDGIIVPPSNATVRVRMVNTTGVMTVNAQSFVEPLQKGHELLSLTCVAFLLEHHATGKKVMFDLGIRKDYWNLAPILQKRLGTVIPSLKVDRDVTEILVEKNIALDSISSVVWSHYHWDHIGNMSLFPPSTEVVVGPGTKSSTTLMPPYPENPNSPLQRSDFEGREVRGLEYKDFAYEIGGFSAHDFFGDGSLYLLDTPGHCVGHMCGLARTSPGDDSTFVLLGGDVCHFVGAFRPSSKLPLPNDIPARVLDEDPDRFPTSCPCSLFTDHHPVLSAHPGSGDRKTIPFYNVSTDPTSAYSEPRTAQTSVDKLCEFDSSSNVLVCVAHDPSLLKYLPTMSDTPELDLNDWRKNGWKEACRWDWLNELPRDGQPGRKPVVEGFWRSGTVWHRYKHELQKLGENAVGTGL